MANPIEYYVDGKLYKTEKSVLSVAEILEEVGLPVDEYCLISSDNTRSSDIKQNIEIDAGDRFVTDKQDSNGEHLISYKVNGEQLCTSNPKLTVEEILQDAGKAASIDLQQLDSYYLENIKTCEKYETLTDLVEIIDKDEFLALYSGATPVACFSIS